MTPLARQPLNCCVTLSCSAKKKVVLRRTMKRRVVPSPHGAANTTSSGPRTQPAPDRKAALKRRIQDILNGRSRFVIRKDPAGSSGSGGRTPAAGRGGAPPSPPSTTEEEKKDRCSDKRRLLELHARSRSQSRLSAAWSPRPRRTRGDLQVPTPGRTEGPARRRTSAPGRRRRRKGGRKGRKGRGKAARPARRTELP